jgi:EAL domain-containing protein (putative c-di-GMP-specific phosphodiesterase class I)
MVSSASSATPPVPSKEHVESFGQRLRQEFTAIRIHTLSVHDSHGETLWLDDGTLGPDEHFAVREGIEALAADRSLSCVDHNLGDGRVAMLLRAPDARGRAAGAAMIIVDGKQVGSAAAFAKRCITPAITSVLSELGRYLRPSTAATQSMPIPDFTTLSDAAVNTMLSTPAASSPPAGATASTLSLEATTPNPALKIPENYSGASVAVHANAPASATPQASNAAPARLTAVVNVSPEVDRLDAALRKASITLMAQMLQPLRIGSRISRYEVLMRWNSPGAPNEAPVAMLAKAAEHGLGCTIDRRVLVELIGWLVKHPQVWQDEGLMLSMNLSSTALVNAHFLSFVQLCLTKADLPPGLIGFEINEQDALVDVARTRTVIESLYSFGCPVVLDNFTSAPQSVDLLRTKGVRLLKIDPKITANLRSDKVSQAFVASISQLAKVLGLHTSAKRVESVHDKDWLAALGVDFAQGHYFAHPGPLDTTVQPQVASS